MCIGGGGTEVVQGMFCERELTHLLTGRLSVAVGYLGLCFEQAVPSDTLFVTTVDLSKCNYQLVISGDNGVC
jgi:hypothetical protein